MISKIILNPEVVQRKFTFPSSPRHIFPISHHFPPLHSYVHIQTYVQVYMKWKKDPYFDSIDSIRKSLELKPIISVKNFFISSSSPNNNYAIPISLVSKRGSNFGISMKVARFLRSYPSLFQEFKGPQYDLPWFRLTQNVIDLDKEERMVYDDFRHDIVERLKKFILMSGSRKILPLKVIKGHRWNLGLPDVFWEDPLGYVQGYGNFGIVDIEDGLKGLAVLEESGDGQSEKVLSVMQRNAMAKGVYSGHVDEAIEFPLFPSKGLRLKKRIGDWLDKFQRLPYVSPYDGFSALSSDSDISEKRVVGLLHELLCLFVEHAAERKSLLCLRKYFGLPQKVHKAFERHPHIFYLSLKNKTCTAILKEAYRDPSAIEPHPLASVRKKYIVLMKESDVILRNRRMSNSKAIDQGNSRGVSCPGDESSHLAEA